MEIPQPRAIDSPERISPRLPSNHALAAPVPRAVPPPETPVAAKEEPEYVTDAALSKGDFCTVWKARRRCVLKEFDIKQDNVSINDQIRDKWIRTIEALIKIRGHDGVVVYRDVFSQFNKVYVEMEYCDGGNLNTFVLHKQPGNDTRHRFMVEMSSALSFLHSNNIIHQNIQPGNVMVIFRANGQPTVKLANFGISKLIATTRFYGDLVSYFMLGEVAGKYYLAPELLSSRHCDMSADIYSLALLFAAMIISTTYEDQLAVYLTTQNGGVHGIGECASQNKCDIHICPQGIKGVYAVINMMLRYDYRTRPSALEVENQLRKTSSDLYPPIPVRGPFLSPMIKKVMHTVGAHSRRSINW